MFYNPVTMRWEGNENALSAFDPPASSPSTASLPPYMIREKENATPRPALITPIGATKGVQVVGGMVFDPQNMCWLKLGPQSSTKSEVSDPMDGINPSTATKTSSRTSTTSMTPSSCLLLV